MPYSERQSPSTYWGHVRPRRLLHEDPGVIGCSWFARDPNDKWHVHANIFRIFITLLTAPFYLLMKTITVLIADHTTCRVNNAKKSWFVELSSIPDSVLYSSPSHGRRAQYGLTGTQPDWMLRVEFHADAPPTYDQVRWCDDIQRKGYTAMSYFMYSAFVLFREAGLTPLDPKPSGERQWSLKDRKRISECILHEYAAARARYGIPPGTEYIWLDELCLSDESIVDEREMDKQRTKELGRLSDIFRRASKVCVFCDAVGCDHTGLDCHWGSRLFTIGEILHASEVLVMTRTQLQRGGIQSNLTPWKADHFREAMKAKAEQGQRWHLLAIMQHAANCGAVPWQAAIHSLIVEAIRRDDQSRHRDHRMLGKALNGLLPRRARLDDLEGRCGWEDLAWLLELNQGFYNPASLAAVCNLSEDSTSRHRWLGGPIAPAEGNERLEPIVSAFPIDVPQPDNTRHPALCVIGPKTIPIQHQLRRDPNGLYNNKDVRWIRGDAVRGMFIATLVASFLTTIGHTTKALVLIYASSVAFCIVELVVSTMYIVREGWVYIDDTQWGPDIGKTLGAQDRHLRHLAYWGERQLVPKWDPIKLKDSNTQSRAGTLVDLNSRVAAKTNVLGVPNDLIMLAVHGCGITCMLLHRPDDPKLISPKVGMVNLPPYILVQSQQSGTVFIGGTPQEFGTPPVDMKSRRVSRLAGLASFSAGIGAPLALEAIAKVGATETRSYDPR
ncbi:hypothetical protein BDQ12DRAFT_693716 [Crucibulum laeve]|uniref:Heterokaryon incompatibility domain-containing protein n=1 Tax=Crucibulum laeve TaxID=68775 RepID=A0A5C3LG52_9AGAR|nr:hypothetical protein BDQ12DRAFT_693716 [Crucibulum laeve]